MRNRVRAGHPTDDQTQGSAREIATLRAADRRAAAAANALVDCYRRLARHREHLLAAILDKRAPVQWAHYPDDDAIGRDRRYQWFYHSHDPEDRAGSGEHGHIHLFARMEGVAAELNQAAEAQFLRSLGTRRRSATTRHLLAIGLNAVGVPISLFTVNRWVTGDLPLSGSATVALLESLRLDTGFDDLDTVIQSVVAIYHCEVRALIAARDAAWAARSARGPGTLEDRGLEVPSFIALDVDRRLAEIRHTHAARRTEARK